MEDGLVGLSEGDQVPTNFDESDFTAYGSCPLAGDVNANGAVNAIDIQIVVNAALGIDTSPHSGDASGDGFVNAVDIQLVINAVLGFL